jgi:hypothetical protein
MAGIAAALRKLAPYRVRGRGIQAVTFLPDSHHYDQIHGAIAAGQLRPGDGASAGMLAYAMSWLMDTRTRKTS